MKTNTQPRKNQKSSALTVKSGIKGGIRGMNHSRPLLKASLTVKSGIKGGIRGMNHSRQMVLA